MSNFNYPKGSEWRKWDLHVHTPFSILNNQFGNPDEETTWDNYVKELFKKAIEKNIAVIGITDYFVVEGYKKIKNEYLNNDSKLESLFTRDEVEKIKGILLLPNVEFRLNKFVGRDSINFHVIFSDEIKISEGIEEQFLRELDFVYEGNPQSQDEKWKLKVENLIKLGEKLKKEHSNFGNENSLLIGTKNAIVDDSQIMETLHKKPSTFKNKFLILLPADEDLSKIDWNSRDHNARKVLIQKSDILFSSNENTKKWALGYKHNKTEDFINEFKTLKPCIWGSDAHSFDKLFEPEQKRYTWIKTDPTFEGFRQILFEPEARVRIMEKNPLEDFPKPYFSSIKINETKIFNNSAVKFTDNEISLNPDLVTIIGGRGTGKSLLLDSIAKTFNKNDDERVKALNIDSDKFLITYRKDDNDELEFNINKEDNYLDYLHIHQGDVKKITDPKNPTELDEEIKKLLGIQYDIVEVESEKIEKIIDELFEINDFLNKKNDNDETINSEEYLNQEISKKETLIKNITTKETKDLIKNYTDNYKTISDKENFINKLNRLKEDLNNFLETANKEIEEINDNLINDKKIPAIDLHQHIIKIDKLLNDETINKNQLEEKNNEIQEDFIKKGIKGDITSLLEQVGNYQKEIETLKKQKFDIPRKKESFESKINSLKEIIESQNLSKEKYKNKVLDKWSNIKKGKEGWSNEQKELLNELLKDINIDFQEIYDSNELVKTIRNFLNLKKFQETTDKKSNERILETFNLNEKDGVINLIKGEKQIDYNGEKKDLYELLSSELFAKRGSKDFVKYLLIENKNFWKIISVPKYKNKTIDNLSVGMKGTMYVCLKLATDPFLKPFIFDQPEDDLDNDFIMNELVPLFRKIKKYRQVIIVTHNANLVVNADAEQVIVAENNDENISYKSGSIENLDIREKIYQILEGGKTAFEKREKKYGFRII